MASNKLRALNGQKDDEAKMDMSPMIDMVFLLLIFFIVVSTPMQLQVDAKVDPAVAYNAVDPGAETEGRIVVNIREDGSIYPSNIKDGELKETDDITRYVRNMKDVFARQGHKEHELRLHLRGDKNVIFKHSQKVINAAAKGGVNQVVFVAYDFQKK